MGSFTWFARKGTQTCQTAKNKRVVKVTGGSHPGYGQALAVGAIIVAIGWAVSLAGCGANLFPGPRMTDKIRERCPDTTDGELETMVILSESLQDEGVSKSVLVLELVINESTENCSVCQVCFTAIIDHVYGP